MNTNRSLLASLHYQYSSGGEKVPSLVRLLVTRLEDNKTWPVSAPHTDNRNLVMISSVSWTSPAQLAVTWRQHDQRSAVFSLCSPKAPPILSVQCQRFM